MKQKTYKILSRLPIVGTIVDVIVCDPSIRSSLFRDEGLDVPLRKYQEQHPDEVITRKVMKKIFSNK